MKASTRFLIADDFAVDTAERLITKRTAAVLGTIYRELGRDGLRKEVADELSALGADESEITAVEQVLETELSSYRYKPKLPARSGGYSLFRS